MIKRVLSVCVILLLSACVENSFEAEFLQNERSRSARVEKMENLSLEEQYKIFHYGNQKIHPADKGLARPLAKKGKAALDYILRQIRESENDLDFRDSIIVFRDMQQKGYYDVCGNASAMKEIKDNLAKIRNISWHGFYNKELSKLCR